MTDLLKRKKRKRERNKKTLRRSLRHVRSRIPPLRNGSPRWHGPQACPVLFLTIPTDSIPYIVLKGCGIRKVERTALEPLIST